LLVLPGGATAHDCACRDLNGDGACDAADAPVSDAQWLAGVPFEDLAHPFVVPAGCAHVLTSVPTGGIRVTAQKIVFSGELVMTPPGGAGIIFTATQDIVFTPGSRIASGGVNSLPTNIAANAAISRASIALKAGGTCSLLGTSLHAHPASGFSAIGLQCVGDIVLHGSELVAAGVNIQSLAGKIEGSRGPAAPAVSLLRCDDPTLNPNGNDNGVFDDGDLPCTIAFPAPFSAGVAAVSGFCAPANVIRSLNNPTIMIAKGDVDLGLDGPGNVVEGRYKVGIHSEDGDVDLSHALIANGLPGITPPGGATVVISADPGSVTRYPLFRDTVVGPFNGVIDVAGACFRSPNPVVYNGTVVGTPEPNGCFQSAPPTGAAGALRCDVQGNNNGVLDAGDFPCAITFTGSAVQASAAVGQFCGVGFPNEEPKPDVAIAKLADPDPVTPGGLLTYAITIQNVGPIPATDVTVRDPLPAGTAFVSCAISAGQCTHNAGVVTASIGTLAVGQSVTMTLKVNAPAVGACTQIENTATVTATDDSNPNNNTATVHTGCAGVPDVAIAKVDTPDPVAPGGQLTYEIAVTNVGTVTATNVRVTDRLPTGTSFHSCAVSPGTCTHSAGLVTANLGSLTAGQQVVITLKVTAPAGAACTRIDNTATVTATGDVNDSNDSATAHTQCRGVADVAIEKIDTPDPVAPGGEMTYTITVRNVGTDTATDVVVTDPLPAGTTFVSCHTAVGQCALQSGVVRATIGSLPPGQSVVVTLKLKAPTGGACTRIDNTATVTATGDGNANNNSASASTGCRTQFGQGCTPGYWKQDHHFDSWPAPYTPTTRFSAVFDNAFGTRTLAQVLSLGGGGLSALGRHTVAALLNAASSGVNYDLTAAEVIARFNAIYPGTTTKYETLKNEFAGFNEQGCPLN
jgi:uncharacterized repeat protein (TIGR01451 family)